jgi:hypothetical protein
MRRIHRLVIVEGGKPKAGETPEEAAERTNRKGKLLGMISLSDVLKHIIVCRPRISRIYMLIVLLSLHRATSISEEVEWELFQLKQSSRPKLRLERNSLHDMLPSLAPTSCLTVARAPVYHHHGKRQLCTYGQTRQANKDHRPDQGM